MCGHRETNDNCQYCFTSHFTALNQFTTGELKVLIIRLLDSSIDFSSARSAGERYESCGCVFAKAAAYGVEFYSL